MLYLTSRIVQSHSPRTLRKKDNKRAGITPRKNPTPLKIIFSHKTGDGVMKMNRSPHGTAEEISDDEVTITKPPKKIRVNELSVVQLDDLKMKIRRSTRLLRQARSDKYGFAFVEFPTYKTASGADFDQIR